jgi:HAD superfamily hydrolase (TIGR01509 family)
MKPFKAVIFDLDGVIIDSEPLHERVFREIWKEMGFADNHGIQFNQYYGKSDRAVWEDFITLHQPVQSIEELLTWKQEKYLELIRIEKPVFVGIPELIESLAQKYPLAIASGSLHPVIDAVLELKDLKKYFPVRVSSQDVSRPKPAPDIFLRAAMLLNIEPEHCCVIEDSVFGVQAANAAGMYSIAITNTFKGEDLEHANYRCDSVEAIGKALGQ